MPKIQFKRKKSTGSSAVQLSAGEPLYNLADKKFYIGSTISPSSPSKHLVELELATIDSTNAFKVGEAADNYIKIKAGNGITISKTDAKTLTINHTPTIISNSEGRTIAFSTDGATFSHTIPEQTVVDTANQLSNVRTITFDGDASGSFKFDGTADKTVTLSVSNSAKATSADSAKKWTTARTISLIGAVTGTVSFDGSSNVTMNTSISSDVIGGANVTAKGVNGYWKVDATSSTGEVSYGISPYTAKQGSAVFYTGTTNPTLTAATLNFDGNFRATNLYVKDKPVLSSGDITMSVTNGTLNLGVSK